MVIYEQINSIKPYIYEKNGRKISAYLCLPMNEYHGFRQDDVTEEGKYLIEDILDTNDAILTPVTHENRAEWLRLSLI